MVRKFETREVDQKYHNLYGFSIKYLRSKLPKHEDYLSVLKLLASKGDILDFTYEDKTKTGEPTSLHIHGVLKFKRCPYFQNMVPKYYNCDYKQIYDLEGWREYTKKNLNNEEDHNDLSENRYIENLDKIDNRIYML